MPENITITVDDTTETVSLVVTSNTVFGRSLPVVAVAGDYDTDEVTEATNLYYTEARVSANSAVSLNTSKVTFPEAPSDGTPYARQDVGWVSAAGGDYADGGEAGGANRTLGNTDNFSLGFLVNGLKALLLKPIATAVNWLSISPSITNESVLIEAEGTDTNIDIALIPKGSGKGGIGTTTPASTWQVKGSGSTPGTIADGITFFTDNTGIFENYGSLTIALSGVSYSSGNIISIALDLDSSTNNIKFFKNGTEISGSSITPPNVDEGYVFGCSHNMSVSGLVADANFGSPPYSISSGNSDGNGYGNFEYAVPSGYYALNTKNLAEYG